MTGGGGEAEGERRKKIMSFRILPFRVKKDSGILYFFFFYFFYFAFHCERLISSEIIFSSQNRHCRMCATTHTHTHTRTAIHTHIAENLNINVALGI